MGLRRPRNSTGGEVVSDKSQTTMSHLGENPSQAMIDGAYAAAYNQLREAPANLNADEAADWLRGYDA
jgi:hypothetical protein